MIPTTLNLPPRADLASEPGRAGLYRYATDPVRVIGGDLDMFPCPLDVWQVLPRDRYSRAPYDRPCPACGGGMTYPTTCTCDYERRVMALAGFGRAGWWSQDGPEWTPANVRRVNAAMRALDDSGSWPIRNRFSGTDRAIGRVRRAIREGLTLDDGLNGYVRMVDGEIGRIVNAL